MNVVAVPDFSDDAFRRLAIDAEVLVNAQRPIDATALAIAGAHLGGGSRNSRTGVVERSTSNIRRFLAGEPLHDQVVP